MSSQATHPISPPPSASPPSTGVRRHHTISSSSRAARADARSSNPLQQEETPWLDDEPVDEDWVGGVGAVGEKSSLHRQSSLPTKSKRGSLSSRRSGTHTPRGVPSLSTIAGHEGDEEDWEHEMQGFCNEDENNPRQVVDVQPQPASVNPSPSLSPQFTAGHTPSPTPGASGVRRHQSLTHGAQGGVKQMTGLKRAGTLHATGRQLPTAGQASTPASEDECKEEVDLVNPYEDETYVSSRSPPFVQQQYGTQVQYPVSSVGRSSPWELSMTGNDWRMQSGHSFSSVDPGKVDEVANALSAMELNFNYANQTLQAQPPPFAPQAPTVLSPGFRHGGNGNFQKLQFNAEFDGRKTPTATGPRGSVIEGDRSFTAPRAATSWDQKEKHIAQRTSNPSLNYGYNNQGHKSIPSVPAIPPQYLSQIAPRLGANYGQGPTQQNQIDGGQAFGGFLNSPVDLSTLIATKGYNPVTFDTRPPFARYFVIKSYTEDDVHKSLKYEIWSSTDPGNKRLDKAFKECAGRGPIYLFFSVNASGHFCGMAEMLTPVDYTRSSTVWASDKWKGVFKVRWIFVRDIPNASLRHIRLINTAEHKPVTNSRDTQELLPDAGQEMLRIFHTHPARTSLLQDFAYYEIQALQKLQQQQTGSSSDVPSPQPRSPAPQPPPILAQGMNPMYMMNPYSMLSAPQATSANLAQGLPTTRLM